MAEGVPDFPLPVRMKYERDGSVRSAFLSDIDEMVDGGKRKFEEFGQEARRQVDQALSIKRNDFGSLDLGVPELRAAAAAQQARAIAAREVAQATALAAREEQDYSESARLAVAASQALAKEEERAAAVALSHARAVEQVQERLNRQASTTDLIVEAQRRGTTENSNVINGVRAQRVAFTQLGQQMQDVTVQWQMGTSAMTIFVQQAPQAAFALSGLAESSNRFHRAIGTAATFLSGPWGAAIFAATAVMGPFIYEMIAGKSAADEAAKANERFADKINTTKYSVDEVTAALVAYNAEQRKARELTDEAVAAAERQIDTELRKAIAMRESLKATLDSTAAIAALTFAQSGPTVDFAVRFQAQQAQVRKALEEQNDLIQQLEEGRGGKRREGAEYQARIATDPVFRIQEQYKKRREEAASMYKNEADLTRAFINLKKQEEAAIDAVREAERKRGGTGRTERLTSDFGSPLSGNFRTTGRFGDNRGDHRHGGIDYATPIGTPVYATQDGIIEAAKVIGAFGKAVKIGHGAGTESILGHLSRFAVSEGQQVRKGQLVGFTGNTGRSSGPHLHYEVRVNGKPVDPSKGAFPIDAAKVAEEAQKAADELQRFGDRSAQAIQSVTDRFDEQPRLIDQSAAAVADMSALLDELREKNKDGIFDAQIEAAQKARDLAAGAVDAQIAKMRQSADEEYRIRLLILEGRDREAAVVQRLAVEQERLGKNLLPAQRAELEEIAKLEFDRAEAIERATEVQSAYLDATRSVRSEVEAILAGTGKISNFKQIFRQLNARVLTEQVFGGVFRELDEYVKRNTGIGSSVDMLKAETERGASALSTFTDVVLGEADRLRTGRAGASATAVAAGITGGAGGFVGSIGYDLLAAAQGIGGRAAGAAGNDNELVVIAKKPGPRSLTDLTPQEYFNELSKRLTEGYTASLDRLFDTRIFGRLSGVLGGGLAGYATGGGPGAIIGAIKGIKGLPDKLGEALGKAGKGAATGTAVAGIGKSLGIGLSSTGSQIGGAIGSFLPIPGGDIIGAIAGGIIGKLIGGSKRGSATIGGSGSALSILGTSGNSKSFIGASSSAADSIIGSVQRIADALGATVNASLGSVSIGIRDGKYRVDTSGKGITKTSRGAIDFGKDGAEAAALYATMDLIRDGVIQGLRNGTKLLLEKAKDLESGLQKALDFEGVFTSLKAIKDPVGAALDTLDKEFTRLRTIFDEANASTAERAQLEELYQYRRAEAVKQARAQLLGPLDDLLAELTVGDRGQSLRARREAALAAYNPLADRVKAGDVTAFAEFSSAARTLLDISREAFGSQSGYFDIFNEIKSITQGALDAQKAIADAAENRDSPFSGGVPAVDNAGVVTAIDAQTQAVINALGSQFGALVAVNDNLGAILAAIGANGGLNAPVSPIPQAQFF